MADIRINALATTAASTASDDFVAVDGSTNGTRKLNAYSPTFGGSLTVSGAINAVGQSIVVSPSSGTAKGRINSDPYRADVIQVGSNWTGGAQDDATKPSWYWFFDSRVAGDAANLYRVPAGGSSTSALAISSTGATLAGNLTVSGGTITSGSGTLTLNSSANTVVLQSAGTTALTLDSSLNATFAGNVTASKAGTAFYSIESTVNGALSEVIVKGKNSTGTAREARLGLNKYADDVFSIYDGTTERFRLGLTNGNATITGALAINNTVQTAASVASTHKVTISIGGSTYYLLATNV